MTYVSISLRPTNAKHAGKIKRINWIYHCKIFKKKDKEIILNLSKSHPMRGQNQLKL